MTSDPKDAERLAELSKCEWFGETSDIVFLRRVVKDRDATIARLTQERDEARRSVEMLKTRYGYTEPAIEAAEARGRRQATQPSADGLTDALAARDTGAGADRP